MVQLQRGNLHCGENYFKASRLHHKYEVHRILTGHYLKVCACQRYKATKNVAGNCGPIASDRVLISLLNPTFIKLVWHWF